MFFINSLSLSLFLIIAFFLFFHLYSQGNTLVFSLLDFIIYNVQLLLLSTNTDNYDWLQNIKAENIINDYNTQHQTISINKNNHHDTDEALVLVPGLL